MNKLQDQKEVALSCKSRKMSPVGVPEFYWTHAFLFLEFLHFLLNSYLRGLKTRRLLPFDGLLTFETVAAIRQSKESGGGHGDRKRMNVAPEKAERALEETELMQNKKPNAACKPKRRPASVC